MGGCAHKIRVCREEDLHNQPILQIGKTTRILQWEAPREQVDGPLQFLSMMVEPTISSERAECCVDALRTMERGKSRERKLLLGVS